MAVPQLRLKPLTPENKPPFIRLRLSVEGTGRSKTDRPKTSQHRQKEDRSVNTSRPTSTAIRQLLPVPSEPRVPTGHRMPEIRDVQKPREVQHLHKSTIDLSRRKLNDQCANEMLPERILFLKFRHVYAGKGGWYGCHCKSSKQGGCSHNSGISSCLCVSPMTSNRNDPVANAEPLPPSLPVSLQINLPVAGKSGSDKPRFSATQFKSNDELKRNSVADRFQNEPLSCVGHGCGDRLTQVPVQKSSISCLEEGMGGGRVAGITKGGVLLSEQSVEEERNGITGKSGEVNRGSRIPSSTKITQAESEIEIKRVKGQTGSRPGTPAALTKQKDLATPRDGGRTDPTDEVPATAAGTNLKSSEICDLYIMPLNEKGEAVVPRTEMNLPHVASDESENNLDEAETGSRVHGDSELPEKHVIGNMSTTARQIIGEYYAGERKRPERRDGVNKPHETLGKDTSPVGDPVPNRSPRRCTEAIPDSSMPAPAAAGAAVAAARNVTAVSANNTTFKDNKLDLNADRRLMIRETIVKESETMTKQLIKVADDDVDDDDDDDYDDVVVDCELDDYSVQANIKCAEWLSKYT